MAKKPDPGRIQKPWRRDDARAARAREARPGGATRRRASSRTSSRSRRTAGSARCATTGTRTAAGADARCDSYWQRLLQLWASTGVRRRLHHAFRLCEFRQEFYSPRHPETGDLGADRAQPALAARGRQVHVYPRALVGKALQEPRREYVIGAALQGALLHVGDAAVERRVVVVVERKRAYPLAARRSRRDRGAAPARRWWRRCRCSDRRARCACCPSASRNPP